MGGEDEEGGGEKERSAINYLCNAITFSPTEQLRNIVAGYTALVKSLNEELVSELITKDTLTAAQDEMLEEISELTDSLL